jgi:hypothetical protein
MRGRNGGQLPRLSQKLIQEAQPAFDAWHIPEPKLVFAGQRLCEDPKTGIVLFGPAALDQTPRQTIRLGVIGTGDAIQCFANWVKKTQRTITAGLNVRGKPYDPILAPDFPGFDAIPPFQCSAELDERLTITLTGDEISAAIAGLDFQTRVRKMVSLVSERLQVLEQREPAPDVVVCVMPLDVEDLCGTGAKTGRSRRVPLTKERKAELKIIRDAKTRGQLLFPFFESEEGAPRVHQFRDFHNTLKAHAMRSTLPTQLVWERTLRGVRGTEDPATTAWIFFTALYYKAGNVPWSLQFSTPRSCFVGITFYRESPDPNAATRTCLAQAFSETGEGLVLRGERVTWDKERDKKPHLSREDAWSILRRVIDLYQQHFGGLPNRVVVHKTSRYWADELAGFQDALGGIHTYDFLALERRGIRFLRLGYEPPVRGTVVELGRRNYLIYTRGYVPFLRVYPGLRIPNPLEVVEHHGDSSAERVCTEILALTKLNWNTSTFASADPVTIAFSRQVATIIKELPEGVEPLTKYRYYM